MMHTISRKRVTQTSENRRFETWMGDIGKESETIIFEPIEAPVETPIEAPVEAPAKEPVPA